MSIEAMKQVIEAFDALPPDHPARYADLQINALRATLSHQPATPEPVARCLTEDEQLKTTLRDPVIWVRDIPRGQNLYTHPAPGVPHVDFELQELREIERAMDDFADCGETDVVDTLLLRAVQAGFLECTHFHVANRGALQEAITAAQAQENMQRDGV